MGRRYSLMKRGAELARAYKALKAYEDLTDAEKSAAYQQKIKDTGNLKSAVSNKPGYLIPFGFDPAKKNAVRCKIIVDGAAETGVSELATGLVTKIQTATAKRAFETLTAGTWNIDKEKASVLARVTLTQIGAKNADAGKSRITGSKYTYRKRNSVSQVFGQPNDAAAAESYETAKAAISTALAVDKDTRAYFRPQGNITSGVVEAK